MIFNSLTFIYFLATLMVVNALLPIKFRNIWVLIASVIFYASWSPLYLLLLIATAAVDYTLAIKMASFGTKSDRKPYLILSIFLSLGSLIFFKYSPMLMGTAWDVSRLFNFNWRPPLWEIALPLGISFYTFETISYSVDVYRGDLKPKRNFFHYLSFLMFFPKLIAGPIVRASELLHQIPMPRVCTPESFRVGLNLLMIGFAKKVLFADNFAPFIEKVFANPMEHNRYMALVAIYGYSMQVYLDFSAYSDIARGCAKWLGYELPENFNKPYLALSISDFWRRWHMTLSRWMRDYLYIPLGGNLGGKLKNYRNLFITMVVGGIWHGANWTFVAWGAMNGLFLVVEKLWYDIRGTKPKAVEKMLWPERIGRWLLVFNLITFTRIFFRSPNFTTAINMIMAVFKPNVNTATIDFSFFLIPIASIAYILASRYREKLMAYTPKTMSQSLVYGFCIAIMIAFGASNAEFIYFQF